MNSPLVFAYGSNLDTGQMKRRCPGASPMFSATLRGFQLAFAGYSTSWKGGIATVEIAPASWVHGLVYRVPKKDLANLDAYEGVPWQYQRVTTRLRDVMGHRHKVNLYLLRDEARCVRNQPSVDYLCKILLSYERLGFPRRGLLSAAMRRT